MRKSAPKAKAGILAALAALTILGTAVPAAAKKSKIQLDAEEIRTVLRQRGLDPHDVTYPHGLTEEMQTWARQAVRRAHTDEERLNRLQEQLLNPERMSVEYQWGYTGTAREVFEMRKANCLAFTNLFVGMARYLGVGVYYLGVDDIESYRKEGDLVVVSDHIAVGYGTFARRKIFDFSENPPDDYHMFKPLSDLTAMAMFHSNRGAEALQIGLVDVSIKWLEVAVRIDPELTNAWVNLGVARRRFGDLDGAEEAYRKALDIDPRTFSAYQNLASLLRLQRRHKEALAFEQLLATSPSRNPYTYLTLGDISLMGGRLDEAEKLYRRAIRLNRRDTEAYAALGHLAASTGDLRTARKMMKKAQKHEDAAEYPRLRRLETMLAQRQ